MKIKEGKNRKLLKKLKNRFQIKNKYVYLHGINK